MISRRENNTRRIAALDERAETLGLKRGMGVADAQAMHPGIRVVEEDAIADSKLLESIADWCDRYTPLVALDGPDGLFLDITGCAHLSGGEDGLLRDLLSRLEQQGIGAKAGIASTAGAAWACARFSGRSIVEPGAEAYTLTPLPLAALRFDPETRTLLEGVGLRTAGALMSVPRGPLARRFGRSVLLRLDQALGEIDETISPRLPVPPLSVERRLAEPIVSTGDIERLILILAGALKQDLERRDEGARGLQLLLFRVDGAVSRIATGASRPVRDPLWVLRLFRERLIALQDRLDAGYGFDLLRLCVTATAPFPLEQIDLAASSADAEADLALLTDRICARLGETAVRRPVLIESHVPERAVAMLPVSSGNGSGSADALSRPLERPIRLLEHPEPVEVSMAEVPEGPPANFRWRRAQYRVARAEGPERISPEWWLESQPPVQRKENEEVGDYERRRQRAIVRRTAHLTRDYFRVEDTEGRRYWLYRQGLYGMSEEQPRWFLHGLFA